MGLTEREMYIEWISLIENFSIGERTRLNDLSDEALVNKYKLALLKSSDEINE